MAALSFSQAGSGQAACGPLPLEAVQGLALACGFTKPDAAHDKPLAQRVDMHGFFKAVGCNSLSAFRSTFYSTPMAAPQPGSVAAPLPAGAKKTAATTASGVSAAPAAGSYPVPNVTEYDKLAAGWEGLKWRMIPRPGGATMKPDDWYAIYATVQQVGGDVKGEKPMWAESGGLDFDGRERWEAWQKLEGKSPAEAKAAFCAAYARAMSREAENFRKSF